MDRRAEFCRLGLMLGAIQLDDQPAAEADEIQVVAAERRLSAEVEPLCPQAL